MKPKYYVWREGYVLADETVATLAGSVVVLEQGVLPQLIYGCELLLGNGDGFDAHGLLEVQLDADFSLLPLEAVELRD